MGQVASSSPSGSSMEDIARLTNLRSVPVLEAVRYSMATADAHGTTSRESLNACFEDLVDESQLSEEDMDTLGDLVARLYDAFDADGNGVVDSSELTSGLSVLCSGSRDEKAAFAIYDTNGDGVITLEEMTSYLTSVFKIMHETDSEKFDELGVSPEELASVTAEQAFEDAGALLDAY